MGEISYRIFGAWTASVNRPVYKIHKLIDDLTVIEHGVDGKTWSYKELDKAEAYCKLLNEGEEQNGDLR